MNVFGSMNIRCAQIVVFVSFLLHTNAFAQGEDGTTAERNILILAEMLPGSYDNINQHYFDGRLKRSVEERHGRMHVEVRRIDAADFGDAAFTVRSYDPDADAPSAAAVYGLEVDHRVGAVRMKTYQFDKLPAGAVKRSSGHYAAGCDVLWREEAGQFHGVLEQTVCEVSSNGSGSELGVDFFLSEDALWVEFREMAQSHFVLERARSFSCYVDVPGVGGGRDIPYKRYPIEDIHDKGGKEWLTLDDGREVYVKLQNVRWPINNLENIFTRHSFVMYVGTRENGEENEVSYTWTIPTAQRIGMNLKWLLANCYMLSNEEVTPYFKAEPLR